MTEYPTLTELMKDREPGSVKVRGPALRRRYDWLRPMGLNHGEWWACDEKGMLVSMPHDDGPWWILSSDPPALSTLRLEIAGRVLAELPADDSYLIKGRYAYALEEADALIKEAQK